jgi:hypothetical protein
MIKKIILLSLLSLNINATEYKLEINKTNYNDSVKVLPYEDPLMTCVEPLVLNETKDECVSPIPTCSDPLILNENQDACIDPIEAVGWIYTDGDTCNGMRQFNFNPNVYIARARTTTRTLDLEIPQGYHWMTKTEYNALFNASTVANKNDSIRVYYGVCGISAYAYANGIIQYGILFKNELNGMHSSHYEHMGVSHSNYSYPTNLLGYFLYKD